MMKCEQCGANVPEGTRFCTNCGAKLPEEVKAEEPVKSDEPVKAEEPAKSEEPVKAAEPVKAEEPAKSEEPVKAEESVKAEEPAKSEEPVKAEESVKAEEPAKSEEPAKAEESVKAEEPAKAAEPVKTAEPVKAAAAQPAAPVNFAQTPETGKKGGKKKLYLIGAAAVVVVLLVVLNLSSLGNFVKRTFSSPEKYYQWTEKNTAEELASSAASVYANYLLDSLQLYDTGAAGSFSVELGDAGKDMLSLAGLTGVDLSWLEKAGISYEMYVKDNMTQLQLGVGLEKELLTLDVIADMEEYTVWFAIPEISDSYIGLEAGELYGMDYLTDAMSFSSEDVTALLKKILKSLPEEKTTQELLAKYVKLALSCLDDVEMKKGKTLRAEGVTQNCTALEVEIDGRTLQNILEAVTEELAEDKQIKKLIVELGDTVLDQDIPELGDYDFDGEELYELFQELCEELNEGAAYLAAVDDELLMTVYVDNKGVIRGRRFEYEGASLELAFPHSGSDFGFKAEVSDGGSQKIALTGSGKDKGGKLTGEFAAEYNGLSLVECAVKDFDTEALKKAELSGEFTFKAGSAIGRVTELASAAAMISDMELTLDTKLSAKGVKLGVELAEDKDMWGKLSLAAERKSGKKISAPSEKKTVFIEDVDDFEEYWDTVDFKSLLKTLDKQGVPSEYVDLLEDIADLDFEDLLSGNFYSIFMPYSGYNAYDAWEDEASAEWGW